MFRNAVLILAIFVVSTSCAANDTSCADAVDRFLQAVSDNAGKAIYAQLQSQRKSLTYAVSPLPVYIDLLALSMFTYNDTLDELLDFFGLNDIDEVKCVLNYTLQITNDQPDGNMYLRGTDLVTNYQHRFTGPFMKKIQSISNGTIKSESLDFRSPTSVARRINIMIEILTNDKVKGVVTNNNELSMNQINVFLGQYLSFESEEMTEKPAVGPYYDTVSGTTKVKQTLYAYQRKILDYTNNDFLKAQVLKFPSRNNFIEDLIFVPNDRNGYLQVAQKLASNPSLLQSIYDCLEPTVINLGLPRYKNVSEKVNTRQFLQMVSNLSAIFDNSTADFQNMTRNDKEISLANFREKIVIEYQQTQSNSSDCLCGTLPQGMKEANVLIDRRALAFILLQRFPLFVVSDDVVESYPIRGT